MLDEDNPILVPGRDCGTCNVCCVALTINDPALKKVQGYRCPNTLPDKSCAIYESRPRTCRTFYCGWRRLKWIKDRALTASPQPYAALARLYARAGKPDDMRRALRARGGHLNVGDPAPDFSLIKQDKSGRVQLSAETANHPVVLVFGSYT